MPEPHKSPFLVCCIFRHNTLLKAKVKASNIIFIYGTKLLCPSDYGRNLPLPQFLI